MLRLVKHLLWILVLIIVFLSIDNNWEKTKFYITNSKHVIFYNMKLKYNFGMSFKIMNDTIVLSRIGEIGDGDVVIIADAAYKCENDIIEYYKSCDNNQLISYNSTTFKSIPALSVEYYALPSKTYMHSIFLISKKAIIGYSGPKTNMRYFQDVIDSVEFID